MLALSVLHLLENTDDVIARIYRTLRPGGVFVTSTACLADDMKYIKLVLPVGKLVGLMPHVEVFSESDLVGWLEAAGFEINHRWKPGKGKAVFIVAMKPDR